MKKILLILITVLIPLSLNQQLFAEITWVPTGGYGYEASRRPIRMMPAILFTLITIGAIIAVGVHNRSKSSGTNG